MRPSIKKYLKVLINLVIALAILLLCIMLVPKVIVFFMPFIVGYIIALMASPLVRFFEEKLKIKRKAGTVFVIVAVIALIVLCIYLISAKLVQEIIGFIEALPQMWSGFEADFKEFGNRFDIIYKKFPTNIQAALGNIISSLSNYLGDIIGKISSPTIEAVGNFAKQVPSVLISVIMALLSAYFFVAEKYTLTELIGNCMPDYVNARFLMIKRSLSRAVGGYLIAQLKIEVWMYLLLVIGFSILKVDYALLIAVGVAFLDLLPFFGTGTVLVPWSVIKFINGDYMMGIGLLIIWGVGQLARQIIQPKIVGDSIGVSPLPTLFLLFVGYKLAGVIGMIIAVPIGIIIYTMYQEGAFDTSVNSLKILVAGVNGFRKLTDEDMAHITPHKPIGSSEGGNESDSEKGNKRG